MTDKSQTTKICPLCNGYLDRPGSAMCGTRHQTAGLPPIGSCATCGRDINYGESYIIGGDRKRRHNACHTLADYKITDLDDLLAMDKRELMDEVMRLRAALKGYEVMLTHFENVFLEAQTKLREMQNV